jgi:hypothetical protein
MAHVANKLKTILPSKHIDLLLGTHYDQDHLAGLIDVADQFSIEDAILPPVRRPRYPKPGAPTPSVIEALRFNAEDFDGFPLMIELTDEQFAEHIGDLEAIAAAAENQLLEIDVTSGIAPDFENEILIPDEEFDLDTEIQASSPFMTGLTRSQLTRIRASAHKGAIVAKWLQKLVRKLQSKNVPIRAIDIQAGQPKYYEWNPNAGRFILAPATYSSSSEPKFTLLGPSRSLIAQHAKRLPIGVYLAINGQIPLKPVTASNQLSYVILFEAAGQEILVSGDAGCVDFWDKSARAFYPRLLTAIKHPQVVQVAHHAGDNHRFYHVLLASGYARPNSPDSFLLLSHADHDVYRPSFGFARFVHHLRRTRQNFELLTTSQPSPSKVRRFKTHYHPATQSPPASTGDIRLSYSHPAWKVDQHVVQA